MPFYEVVLNGTLDGEPMLTVLHYEITGSNDFQALSDRIAVLMTPDLQNELVNSAQYSGITVREDVPGSVGITYNFTGGLLSGLNAETEYWGLIAANVRKLTSSGNRPAQGRIYQGGIPATATTSAGNIGATYAANLQAAWDELVNIVFDGVGNADMVIKATNPTAPNTVPYNPVTSLSVSLRPAKQSRRNWLTG